MADDLTLGGLPSPGPQFDPEAFDVPKVDTPSPIEDADHFERRERATLKNAHAAPKKNASWFATHVASLVGRRKPVVAAVLMALALPSMTGCVSDFTRPPQPTEISITQADQSLAIPLVSSADYREHIRGLREALSQDGLPTRADGVPIWVVTDNAEAGASMVRVIADEDLGIAPGARVHLQISTHTVSPEHVIIRGRVAQGIESIEQGGGITDALIRDLGQLLIYDAAARIQAADYSRIPGQTNLMVLSMDQSPLDMAERLLTALSRAGAGSEAHSTLTELGSEAQTTQLAARIVETLKRRLGQRAISSAEWQLEKVLEKVRSHGVLVMRAAGDSRVLDDGSKKAHSRALANDLELLPTIGAVDADGTVPLGSAFGPITLSAIGPQGQAATHNTTDNAAAYTTATAALMLAARPDASPEELQHFLTDPSARKNVAGTGRDGLGQVDVHQAVKLASQANPADYPSTESRYRAVQAMKSAPDIAEDHAYLAHIQHLRKGLNERGLPTRGDGVQVFVIEPSWGQHAGGILRTVADEEIGVAPGTDVHLITEAPWYSPRERKLSGRIGEAREKILEGTNFDDTLIVDQAERSILSRAADVRQVAGRVDGSQLSFVNMSYGTTSSTIASGLLKDLADAPQGSEAALAYAALGGTETEREHPLVEQIGEVLARPSARIDRARNQLADEVKQARLKRVMVFTSAGNTRDKVPHADRGLSAHVEDGTPGLMVVGACEYFDPTDITDDRITKFSSEGHISFCAPGDEMPVKIDGADGRGTSYALPYGIGVGVLMAVANPDLTVEEVEAIMLAASHDIPTTLDGAGVINLIEAVMQASLHLGR